MSKKQAISGTPNLQNTAYFDLNRNFSVKSEDTSTWEYPINNGMRLPPGTQVEIINTHLNYPGIVGSAMEILDDVDEEICYGFYATHGSFLALSPTKYGTPETGYSSNSNDTTGMLLTDVLQHRNTENSPTQAPLMQVISALEGNGSLGTALEGVPNDPSTEIIKISAKIPDFDITVLRNATPTPADIPLVLTFPEIVYEEYFKNFSNPNNGFSYTYFGGGPDIVIDINVTNAGLGYAVGDALNFSGGGPPTHEAFGYITKIGAGGIIISARVVQVGAGYSSAPTISITTTAGAGALLQPIMGRALGTTTNGSGVDMVIGGTGDFNNVTPHCILRAGVNYRSGDKVFVNDGPRPSANFFPQNNQLHLFEEDKLGGVASVNCNFTTAMDIPSPGFITIDGSGSGTVKETIYYSNANAIAPPTNIVTGNPTIHFTRNENKRLDNDKYFGAQMYDLPNGAGYMSGAQNAKYKLQMSSYVFPPILPPGGANGTQYHFRPRVVYRPNQYEEEFLNTNDQEPQFVAVMNGTQQVEKVVYLGRCRDDLSLMNTFIDEQVFMNGDGVNAYFGCQPGQLAIIGGNPASQAFCSFEPCVNNLFPGTVPPTTGQTFTWPQELKRYVNNTGGVKLGFNIAVVQSTATGPAGAYTLAPILEDPRSGSGTGCQVTVTLGFGLVTGPICGVEVTSPGQGYKVGERYMIPAFDTDDNPCVLEILEVSQNTDINNPQATSAPDIQNRQYIRPNKVTDGIMDNLNNNMSKPALIKGKTNILPGDATVQSTSANSTLPRFNFQTTETTGFDSIDGVGGSNEPIGCVEFTDEGYLKPFIITSPIFIPRGVYGVTQLSKIISDQLSKSETNDYNVSAISKLIPINNYEVANFSGVQNYHAGRKIFVSMRDYNILMQLYRDLTPGTNISDTYKWENFRFTHYYAFPKNFFPNGKSPTQQFCSSKVLNTRAGYQNLSNTGIAIQDAGIYDQTREGILIGSTDFELQFNNSKSVFELNFLHSPIRNPVYDKFGNLFPTAGQPGAFLKKLSKQVNITGTTQQYSLQHIGGVNKTPQALLDRFEKPVTRETGIMIHNFAFKNSNKLGDKAFFGPSFARYEDFFIEKTRAISSWSQSFWSRLGFQYAQLNTDLNKELCQYLFTDPSKAVPVYGVTTTQSLDSSVTTTISSLTNIQVKIPAVAQPGGKAIPAGTTTTQASDQIFNMTTSNNPGVPVFSNAPDRPYNTFSTSVPEGTTPQNPTSTSNNTVSTKVYLAYSDGIYNSAMTNFIETDGAPVTASNLPLLIKEGYFLITSDIIDGFKDSVKKNENIPLLAIVPKSNLASQDFVTTAFTNISHTLSQEKVINKILIKVMNPDLTSPILREDSSVLMKITIPEAMNIEI